MPDNSRPILSPDATAAISQVREFLQIAAVVVVTNDSERAAAITLANEIQKKWRETDNRRKDEKKPWDDAGKKVQEAFIPILSLIVERKDTLSRAVTEYDTKQARIRAEWQDKLDADARKERSAIEAQGTAADNQAEAYTRKANAFIDLAEAEEDAGKKQSYVAMANRYTLLAEECITKSDKAQVVAATVVAPILQAPATVPGERKTKKWEVFVIDKKAFVEHCLANDALEYLEVALVAVKRKVSDTDGNKKFPGIKAEFTMVTGVSGR